MNKAIIKPRLQKIIDLCNRPEVKRVAVIDRIVSEISLATAQPQIKSNGVDLVFHNSEETIWIEIPGKCISGTDIFNDKLSIYIGD